MLRLVCCVTLAATVTLSGSAQRSVARVRARDLGVTIGAMQAGPLNAITDVAGVLVGHSTIVRGRGALTVGEGPVRTGVTAVLPRREIGRASWRERV